MKNFEVLAKRCWHPKLAIWRNFMNRFKISKFCFAVLFVFVVLATLTACFDISEIVSAIDKATAGTTETTEATNEPFPKRNSHSSVVLNGALYVIGGIDGKNNLNDVWKSKDGGVSWEQIAKEQRFPVRRLHSSVVLGGAIYVIGGRQNEYHRLNDVWKSQDSGVSWEQVTANTGFSKRSSHSSVVLDGAIYVIGGYTEYGESLSEVWKSENGGVSWRQVATGKFQGRHSHSSVVRDGDIYIIGGRNTRSSIYFDEVWKSENGGADWKQIAINSFPARRNHSSVVWNDAIYVVGGQGAVNFTTVVYDDVWKSIDGGANWRQVTGAFPARYSHSAAVLKGARYSGIYIMGGYNIDRGASFRKSRFRNDVWKSRNGGFTWEIVNTGRKPNKQN